MELAVPVLVELLVGLEDDVAEVVTLEDIDEVGVRVAESEEVAVPESVAELLGEAVAGGDVVLLGVAVAELLEVPVRLDELLGVPVLVAVGVPVVDDELVADGVPEPVQVTLLEAVDDGDEEALRMDAMLRPRKVMEDMAASASPASHSIDS